MDNEKLLRKPSELEIKLVLFEMHPNKSPGPDGFLAVFFQKNWFLLKEEITKLIQDFFESRHILNEFNSTFITLIPKVEFPESPKDFRPISLCDTIYKIISKLLANRIKPFLDKIISPYQSVFVPGRQIADNIVIAQRLFTRKDMRGKNKRKRVSWGSKSTCQKHLTVWNGNS